jgi:NADH:ubiquinone oxidoreductase subunit F (NADH-binding)
VTGFLIGGYFGGLLNRRGLDLALDYDTIKAAGSGLGCGAVTVLGEQDCPVRVAAEVMAYFARENAGQCGSCFNGTAAMSAVLSALVAGTAGPEQLERLEYWSVFLVRRGACGTLDGAAHLAASLVREFPALTRQHLSASCEICLAGGSLGLDAPFALAVPGVQAELMGS